MIIYKSVFLYYLFKIRSLTQVIFKSQEVPKPLFVLFWTEQHGLEMQLFAVLALKLFTPCPFSASYLYRQLSQWTYQQTQCEAAHTAAHACSPWLKVNVTRKPNHTVYLWDGVSKLILDVPAQLSARHDVSWNYSSVISNGTWIWIQSVWLLW